MIKQPNIRNIPVQSPRYHLVVEGKTYVLMDDQQVPRFDLNLNTAIVWQHSTGVLSVGEIIEVLSQDQPDKVDEVAKDVADIFVMLRDNKLIYFKDYEATQFSLNTSFSCGDVKSTVPLIAHFDDFIDAEDCEQLMELARPLMGPARVVMGKEAVISDTRTNDVAKLDYGVDAIREILQPLIQKAADLIGLPAECCGLPAQVLRYQGGEEYKLHLDAFDLNTEEGLHFTQTRGQRVATLLIYLNTVRGGGETEFPIQKVSVPAVQGHAVLFYNCYEGTTLEDPRSLHGAKPVLEGEKWAIPLWFFENPR